MKDGDKCVSVRSLPGRWVYHTPAIYVARPRKADGALTWRLEATSAARCRSRAKALREAAGLAERLGLPLRDVRYGQPAADHVGEIAREAEKLGLYNDDGHNPLVK